MNYKMSMKSLRLYLSHKKLLKNIVVANERRFTFEINLTNKIYGTKISLKAMDISMGSMEYHEGLNISSHLVS